MKQRRIHDFIIDKELGYGAQARVYRGYQKGSNQYVALKEHSPIQNQEEMEFKRQHYERTLINEIGAQPGVIGFLQIIQLISGYFYDERPDGKYYIVVQEYAEKGTLLDYLSYYNVFDTDVAISYCYQLLSAIHALHRINIAHRDIKPGNILLDGLFNLRVCDFGLAVYNRQNIKIKDNVTGTIDYLPPEVLRGEEHDIFKSDVFQLGVNMCLIVTSIHPFNNEPCIDLKNHIINPPYLSLLKEPNKFWEDIATASLEENQIVPQIDEEFKQLIARMLSDNPNRRPSMEEIFQYPYFQRRANHQRVQAYMSRLQNLEMTTNQQVGLATYAVTKETTPKMGYNFVQLGPFEYSYHGDFKAIRNYIQSVIVPSKFEFISDDIVENQDCLIEIREDKINYVFNLLFRSGTLQILRPPGQLPKIVKVQKYFLNTLFKRD